MDTKTWLKYWRRAVWLAWFLRFLPFVRMVGLNGSMVTGTFRPQSDIDLYIVTKDGHIFLARFLTTLFIHLTGRRIKPGKEAGRFCPNRFAVESFTEITPHDGYHARVFHNLIPLFADTKTYALYVAANRWMTEAGEPVVPHRPVLGHTLLSRSIQRLLEVVLASPALERYVARTQHARVAADPRARHPDSKVIITDRELRFHLAEEVNA